MTGGTLIRKDKRPEIKKRLREMNKHILLIGVPANTANRDEGAINNAALAYVHEFGNPKHNVPARPFLLPTIADNGEAIGNHLFHAAVGAVRGRIDVLHNNYEQLGSFLRDEMKGRITAGIPPPIQPETVKNRYRQRGDKTRRQSEKDYIMLHGMGISEIALYSAGLATPLINTGQLLNSLQYVIRSR